MIINQIYGGGKVGASAHIYAVDIAIDSSDPDARCTYPATVGDLANGCAGFTPASNTQMNDWDGANIIGNIKPVQFDGTDIVDLDKHNLLQKADGTSSNIGTLGYDAMVYIPTWYLSITNDGTYIYVRFADQQLDGTYQDYAGSVGSNRIGRFMLGCYPATSTSSMLYSRYGVNPTLSISISNFSTYAQARGTGYDLMTFYQWTYLQALLVLIYKSTDLQTACARGYTNGEYAQSNDTYIYDNDYGILGTTADGSGRMSFLWLNDLWGNIGQFIGGAYTSSRPLFTSKEYPSIGSGSSTTSVNRTDSVSTYITKVSGTLSAGFFPVSASGTSATYFADYCNIPYVTNICYGYVGGFIGCGNYGGPFYCDFSSTSSTTDSRVGTRLSYRL